MTAQRLELRVPPRSAARDVGVRSAPVAYEVNEAFMDCAIHGTVLTVTHGNTYFCSQCLGVGIPE